MPGKGFSIKPVCHPDRRHVALSLCAACYQRRKITPSPALDAIAAAHPQRKQRLLAKWEMLQPKRGSKRGGYAAWASTLRYRYGITPDQYDKILANQNHLCAVCRGDMLIKYIDHCHVTGKVRGILCPGCNTFVGYIERNKHLLDRIEWYLAFKE